MNKFGTAIILAGGKSRRMGFDKQFMAIGNDRLMDILIAKLQEEFQEIIIVTNKPEEYIGFKERIVTDIIKNKGPLGGIHSGLKESSSQYSFIIACDMPNINMDYIRYMKAILTNRNIDVCVTRLGNNLEPLMGFYSKGIVAEIEDYLSAGNRSAALLIKKLDTYFIQEDEVKKFKSDKSMFVNLNTKEDLLNYSRIQR